MLINLGAYELLSLVVQLNQFLFFSFDCLEGLPPSLGWVQLQMLVSLQKHSECIYCCGACWGHPCWAWSGSTAWSTQGQPCLPCTAGQNQAFNTKPALGGLLSADFSLLSPGIRSRKSSCWRLSASAEAIRECWRQSSALPWPGRVREEAPGLRVVS